MIHHITYARGGRAPTDGPPYGACRFMQRGTRVARFLAATSGPVIHDARVSTGGPARLTDVLTSRLIVAAVPSGTSAARVPGMRSRGPSSGTRPPQTFVM